MRSREQWEKQWPQYQTRWLAYCADQRLRPDRAHAYGFTVWMSPLIREFNKDSPGRTLFEPEVFSAWIWNRVVENRKVRV